MKQKEPALRITHNNTLIWFLQVAEVKGLAYAGSGASKEEIAQKFFHFIKF